MIATGSVSTDTTASEKRVVVLAGHALVLVLQLDDEAREGPARRSAQDRQGAEQLAERTDRLEAHD
jgi:hypothetical protein